MDVKPYTLTHSLWGTPPNGVVRPWTPLENSVPKTLDYSRQMKIPDHATRRMNRYQEFSAEINIYVDILRRAVRYKQLCRSTRSVIRLLPSTRRTTGVDLSLVYRPEMTSSVTVAGALLNIRLYNLWSNGQPRHISTNDF